MVGLTEVVPSIVTHKEDMQTVVHAVVVDLALPDRIQSICEPQRSTDLWGISFLDPRLRRADMVFRLALDLLMNRISAKPGPTSSRASWSGIQGEIRRRPLDNKRPTLCCDPI